MERTIYNTLYSTKINQQNLFVLNKTVKELGSGFTSSQNNTILKIRGIKKEKLKLRGADTVLNVNP